MGATAWVKDRAKDISATSWCGDRRRAIGRGDVERRQSKYSDTRHVFYSISGIIRYTVLFITYIKLRSDIRAVYSGCV